MCGHAARGNLAREAPFLFCVPPGRVERVLVLLIALNWAWVHWVELQAHSQAEATDVTLVILVESSDHGCRFCRAKSDELWTHRGSAGKGCARLFWKASCCSCRRMRFACCLSASRSSAVCRLHWEQAVTSQDSNPLPAPAQTQGTAPGDSPLCTPQLQYGPL